MLTKFNLQSSPDDEETVVQRTRCGSYVEYGESDKLT